MSLIKHRILAALIIVLHCFTLNAAVENDEADYVSVRIESTDPQFGVFPNHFEASFHSFGNYFSNHFTIANNSDSIIPNVYVFNSDIGEEQLVDSSLDLLKYQIYKDELTGTVAALLSSNGNSTTKFKLMAQYYDYKKDIILQVLPVLNQTSIKTRRQFNDISDLHLIRKRNLTEARNDQLFSNHKKTKISETSQNKKNVRQQFDNVKTKLLIELLVVMDCGLIDEIKSIIGVDEEQYAIKYLTIFVLITVKEADKYYDYSFRNNDNWCINLATKHILFLKNEKDCVWSHGADVLISGADPMYLNATAVHSFHDFIFSKSFSFEYDHAVAFTRKNLVYPSSTKDNIQVGIIGVASSIGYICIACVTVIEFYTYIPMILAHETAHCLGAQHDEYVACPSNYLMSIYLAHAAQEFSNCSISEFEDTIFMPTNYSINKYYNCLKYPSKVETIQSSEVLMGNWLTPDDQCKFYLGNNASFCQSITLLSGICNILNCRRNHTSQCDSVFQTMDGTPCETGKVCISGSCVNSSHSGLYDALEIFGDSFVQNGFELVNYIDFKQNIVTCSEAIERLIEQNMDPVLACYNPQLLFNISCMTTCQQLTAHKCFDVYSICTKYINYCDYDTYLGNYPIKVACPYTCKACERYPITCNNTGASSPCRNKGVCINTEPSKSNLIAYKCECQSGWTGTLCERKLQCSANSNPCLNNGKCIQIQSTFICECGDDYEGLLCELSKFDSKTSTQVSHVTEPTTTKYTSESTKVTTQTITTQVSSSTKTTKQNFIFIDFNFNTANKPTSYLTNIFNIFVCILLPLFI